MEITYPFAKVFADSTNHLSAFFCHDAMHSSFQPIGDIGNGLVDFCELDFAPALEKTKALETMEVTSANAEEMKSICWAAVDSFEGEARLRPFLLEQRFGAEFLCFHPHPAGAGGLCPIPVLLLCPDCRRSIVRRWSYA
jgi:hypothetical protein